jgi:hypothetical protein
MNRIKILFALILFSMSGNLHAQNIEDIVLPKMVFSYYIENFNKFYPQIICNQVPEKSSIYYSYVSNVDTSFLSKSLDKFNSFLFIETDTTVEEKRGEINPHLFFKNDTTPIKFNAFVREQNNNYNNEGKYCDVRLIIYKALKKSNKYYVRLFEEFKDRHFSAEYVFKFDDELKLLRIVAMAGDE